jgi:hypothetical protein
MTGGVLRGHALGNAFNAADLQHRSDTFHPAPGRVIIFASAEDPANLHIKNMKPRTFIKHPVTPSIRSVLTQAAQKLSPIKGEFHCE